MGRRTTRDGGLSRRGFLSGSGGALLTGALMGSENLAAAAQQAPAVGRPAGVTRLVDVHHHHLPPKIVEAMKAGLIDGGTVNPPSWSPQIALDGMGDQGVETAMVSISQGVEAPTQAQTTSLARECNEYGAKLVADKPTRFGLFASLPLPDTDASLKEIAYALDTLHADGIGMMSHYGPGKYLGDASYDPVYEELNRRKAVVFVHPKDPFFSSLKDNPMRGVGGGMELPFDTTRAIVSLLGAGTADKFPDIKFIFPHGGGTIPFLASRIGVLGSRSAGFKTSGYQRVVKTLSTFYYDLTNTIEPPSIKAVMAVAPASRLLFGTDVPYGDGPRDQPGLFVKQMTAQLPHVGFSAVELSAVVRRNAEALFPRLKKA